MPRRAGRPHLCYSLAGACLLLRTLRSALAVYLPWSILHEGLRQCLLQLCLLQRPHLLAQGCLPLLDVPRDCQRLLQLVVTAAVVVVVVVVVVITITITTSYWVHSATVVAGILQWQRQRLSQIIVILIGTAIKSQRSTMAPFLQGLDIQLCVAGHL
jgi:hypothetical protein